MRIKKSIFTKLVASFILYAVVMILTFILCIWHEATFIGEGNMHRLHPENVIDPKGNVVNL